MSGDFEPKRFVPCPLNLEECGERDPEFLCGAGECIGALICDNFEQYAAALRAGGMGEEKITRLACDYYGAPLPEEAAPPRLRLVV